MRPRWSIGPGVRALLCLMFSIAASHAWAQSCPQGGDTGESDEVLFCSSSASELKAEADKLASPVEIYEYLRNNYDFALYQGSRSGSVNTFLGGRGNDVDLASTLIAMLRAEGIPARYAVATVQAATSAVMNELHVENAQLAYSMLRDQGIQDVSLSSDQSTMKFEHVWVEALIPYDDYRGVAGGGVNCASNPADCHWVSLDPSAKLYVQRSSGLDPYSSLSFDYTSYYKAIANGDTTRENKNPIEIYEDQVLSWLQSNDPGKTLEDIPDFGDVIADNSGLLPASLPFEVVGSVRRYNSVAEHDAQVPSVEAKKWAKYATVLVNMYLDNGAIHFEEGAPAELLTDLSTQRLTLTTVINGSIPNLIIRLGGNQIACPICGSGTINIDGYPYTPAIGDPFTITVSMDGPPAPDSSGTDEVITATYNAIIGGYYLVATGGESSNWSQVHRAAQQLLDASTQYPIVFNPSESGCNLASGLGCTPYVDTGGTGSWNSGDPELLNDQPALDALTGGLLYVAATQYFANVRDDFKEVDDLNKITSPIAGFLGVVSATSGVQYVDGTAFSVLPSGLLIDMKGITLSGSWRINQPADESDAQFTLLGHITSSLEHETWQSLTGYDAISTVRGIQMALASGATLLNPLKNSSTDTTTSIYPALGFGSTAPSGFTLDQRAIYSTEPASWSYPTTDSTQSFDVVEPEPSSSTDSRRPSLTYANNFYDSNIACFYNIANQLASLESQYGPGAQLNAGTLCISSYAQGTTIAQAITLNQSDYATYQSTYVGQTYFNYLDEDQGFSPPAMEYRSSSSLPASAQRTTDVLNIRDNLDLQNFSQDWLEYVFPSQRSAVPNSQYFEVDIRKVHDTASGNIVSATYEILNEGVSAGGGYVDGTEALVPSQAITGTSLVTPTFNNSTFTDKNTVSQTNNNVVQTPSTADPVSTVTGNNYHDETDFTIKGRGLDYVFTRTYNSAPSSTSVNGPLGYGWVDSYAMTLESNDYGACPDCAPGTGAGQSPVNGDGKTSSVTFTDERGGQHNYLVDETTYAVTPPVGEFNTLTFDAPVAGEQTLTFRNGVQYIFSGSSTIKTSPGVTSRLVQIVGPQGNQLNFGYDSSGRLSTVTDNLGISGRTGLTFSYDGANHLTQITDWSGRTWKYSVNSSGNLASYTNALGQTETYTYTPGTHNLTGVIDPLQRNGTNVETSFAYYQNGRTFNDQDSLGDQETLDYDLYRLSTRVTDPQGNVREYTYDTNGGLVKLVEPDGGVLFFANSADELRDQKTDALGYVTKYSYRTDHSLTGNSDTGGNVTEVTDPYGQTVDTTYGPFDQVATVKDKRGTVRTTAFYPTTGGGSCAAAGKPETVTLSSLSGVSNVKLETFCWNSDGTLSSDTKYVDSAGTQSQTTTYTYETSAHLNLHQITVTGTDGTSVTRTFTYDNLGRKTSETLERRTSPTNSALMPLTTSYQYDALDRVTEVTDAIGNIMQTVYDANGDVYQIIGQYKQANGTYVGRTLSTRTYDAADRLLTDTDATGAVTHYAYDQNGNLLAVTDPNGHVTSYTYDAMNRSTAVIDGNGNTTSTTYDLDGRVASVTDPDGNTTLNQYDELGRLVQTTDPMGYITQLSYDPDDNVTCRIDADAQAGLQPKNSNGCSEYRTYDELNRLVSVEDALNGVTKRSYDLLGDVTSITDASNKTTMMAYDDLGRLTSATDPLGKITYYARDEAGNAYQVTNRLNQVTQVSFDALNRATQYAYLTDGTSEAFGYDSFGNEQTASNQNVTYTFSYDARNRLTQKVDSRAGKSLGFTYDPAGNMLTKTDYLGSVTHFQYDSANRLVAMTNSAFLNASYQYDPAGHLLTRALSDGAKTEYTWDADGRLNSLLALTANGSGATYLTYTRDRMGNALTENYNIGTPSSYSTFNDRTVTYDALYRVTNVTNTNGPSESLTYDAVGNRLSDGGLYYQYEPNSNRLVALHQSSASGTVVRAFTYDDEGRLMSQTSGVPETTPGYATQITWDQKNRAVSMVAGYGTLTFGYDPMDYRIKRNGGTQGSIDYYLEGENLEAEYSNGVLQSRYFRGVDPDELIAGFSMFNGKLTPSIYHQDTLNTVRAMSAHDGASQAGYLYDAFGDFRVSTGSLENADQLRFTGRELDNDTQLYYYRARYYDPSIGRFISEDPVGFQAGVNFYTYAGNNPINGNDPTGDCPQCVAGAIVGGVGGLLFQGGSDLLNWHYSGIAAYVGSTAGGAAGGAAATVCGPLCAGATAGAVGSATTTAINALEGNVTNWWNAGENFVESTALGAVGGKVTADVVPAAFSNVSNAVKGDIGEALTWLDLTFSGQGVADTQVPNGVGRSTFDFLTNSGTYVESKFGTGSLSSVQQQAAAQLGDSFQLQQWDYPTVSGIAASGPAGALGSGISNDTGGAPAAGGYLIYPNQPNNSSLTSAYVK